MCFRLAKPTGYKIHVRLGSMAFIDLSADIIITIFIHDISKQCPNVHA